MTDRGDLDGQRRCPRRNERSPSTGPHERVERDSADGGRPATRASDKPDSVRGAPGRGGDLPIRFDILPHLYTRTVEEK